MIPDEISLGINMHDMHNGSFFLSFSLKDPQSTFLLYKKEKEAKNVFVPAHRIKHKGSSTVLPCIIPKGASLADRYVSETT